MSAGDFATTGEWAAREGWNPGIRDWHAFQAADPEGFLIGFQGGTPVCCISVVRYGPAFGFLGFYIAIPEVRGTGRGMEIWRAGMARLAGRNVGLDGVVAQQDNYRKSGFRFAYRDVRFSGVAAADETAARDPILVEATRVPFDRLAAYDRRFFPEPRDAFLALWIGLPGFIALAAVEDGAVVGLGVARPCREGYKIGPLYGDTPTIAERLARALCHRVAPTPVAIDVPEINPAAPRLARSLGLAPVFETARMYTGPDPAVDTAGMYAVTSLELG
jgi:Acetyltransferase (GNAT) domain